MGFYQPAQLVRDARDHGVEVRPVDILASDWSCTLEPIPPQEGRDGLRAVRLGLREVKGFKEEDAKRLAEARKTGAGTAHELARAARLSSRALELLAEADALRSLEMDRREGLWAVKGVATESRVAEEAPLLALMGAPPEPAVPLPPMTLGAHVAEDYRTAGLSLKAHPCAFFRPLLDEMGAVPAAALKSMKDGRRLSLGGLVLIRQRPGTAKGVVFITLEDETGPANVVVWGDVFAANRRTVMSASFLVVHGRLQRAGEVIHLVAERFTDLTGRLAELKQQGAGKDRASTRPRLIRSRDFH
jgi:error-prone DNA polymerase